MATGTLYSLIPEAQGTCLAHNRGSVNTDILVVSTLFDVASLCALVHALLLLLKSLFSLWQTFSHSSSQSKDHLLHVKHLLTSPGRFRCSFHGVLLSCIHACVLDPPRWIKTVCSPAVPFLCSKLLEGRDCPPAFPTAFFPASY